MKDVVIAIHGGAWMVPPSEDDGVHKGIRDAARAGYQVLARGGSAVDAVVAAVCSMENDTSFNCGTGSVLTEDETIEMDAFVMDGATQNIGAVAGVSNVKNPVRLARAVMEKTNHCFLIGKAASKLAEETGMEIISQEDLITPIAINKLKKHSKFSDEIQKYKNLALYTNGISELKEGEHDTVGAVALDCNGNVAAATSTGGITGKMSGRIGDSALSGSGGWAEANVGAVSISGHGEAIMRVCLSRRVASNMEKGMNPKAAAEEAINHMTERVNGHGGLVAVNCNGHVGVACSTRGLIWAYVKDEVLHSGVFVDKEKTEPV